MKRSREPDDEVPEYQYHNRSPTPGGGDGPGSSSSSSATALCSRESSSAASPLPPAVKIVQLDPASLEEEERRPQPVMKCSLPPHKEGLPFPSYEEYEAHYHKAHTNRCLECRKNFPSQHLLGLHIEECHDSFMAAKRERGDHTYSCFVEGCERKCLTPQKRRLHMIDKHGYPRNYFFALTKEGVDGRRSLLLEGGHRRRSSSNVQLSPRASRRRSGIVEKSEVPAEESMVAEKGKDASPKVQEKEKPDIQMEDLTGAMSALQFIPTSIKFGRGGRAGFGKK